MYASPTLSRIFAVHSSEQHAVELGEALWRGISMRCPKCGNGRLFGRFLKVSDHCAACGEVFSHHRADDFPAYLVIVIVGHLLVPALLFIDLHHHPSLGLECLIALPLAVALAAGLLQPVKGAVVALQWQLGMHGFAGSREQRLGTAR
jgi:uncharacterized protein (DUF983 family)